MDTVEPFLPMGIEIQDAHEAYRHRQSYESFYIKRVVSGTLYFTSRIFYYEVDWTYLFPVTIDQARQIVRAGLAV